MPDIKPTSKRKSYADWHAAYMEEMGYSDVKDVEEAVDKQPEDKDTI